MNDPKFGLQLRMIAALAFVPPRTWLIPLMYFVLLFEISMMEMLMKCLTISRILTLVAFLGMPPRRPPLFPIELWNRFHRTADELSRTNNNIEAWRNSFQANVSSTHPTFWKFLDVLLREERIVRVRMLQNQVGHASEPQRRRCADCNARILKFVDDYPNRQVMDYLRHIAHQFIITF